MSELYSSVPSRISDWEPSIWIIWLLVFIIPIIVNVVVNVFYLPKKQEKILDKRRDKETAHDLMKGAELKNWTTSGESLSDFKKRIGTMIYETNAINKSKGKIKKRSKNEKK